MSGAAETKKPQRLDQHFHPLQVAIGFKTKYKKYPKFEAPIIQ
jgi:hypothetical protein